MTVYGTTDNADAYHAARGNTAWDDLDPDAKAVALQRGSDYVDNTYGDRFPGTPTGGAIQDRSWPRTNATDRWGNALPSDSVPTRVENAAYEAALIEATAQGSLSATVTAGSRVTMEKVGELQVQYAAQGTSEMAVADATPRLSIVEGLLEPLLIPCLLPGVLVV